LVLPEFVPNKFWHFLLHGQTALLIKVALYFRRRAGHRIAVVTSVPYYLGKPSPLDEFEEVRPTWLAPAATLGILLVGILIVLVIALAHAWPVFVEEFLGMVALLLTAALFFLLLLKSLFT
jgi:hypothetical protein